jgi:hypothetical protein
MIVTKQVPAPEDSPEKHRSEPGAKEGTGFEIGEASVGSVVRASWVDESTTIAHGKGISYAGELPEIAVSQVIKLTDFHNRPA